MKNYKIVCLIILFLLSGINMVFAQNTNPTPYQQKQLELSKKWFQILTGTKMSMSAEMFYEQLSSGKEANDFVLGMALLSYSMTNSKSQFEKVITQLDNDYKEAAKLKNTTDFRLEKEAKELKERIETAKKLREEQEAFERTDFGSIQKYIKINFEKWNMKGEFEKQGDYEERLQNQSQNAFFRISKEQVEKHINYYSKSPELGNSLLPYNPDKEYFEANFFYNGVKWQNRINISIKDAQDFKYDWDDLKFEFNKYDWAFVNNELCPTLVKLSVKNRIFQMALPLENINEIAFSFNDLGIKNTYLNDFVFKYSDAKDFDKKIAREKFVNDSLEMVKNILELESFNKKLEKAFLDYNMELLAIPYNINKSVITKKYKISLGNNHKHEYENSLNFLRNEFERIKKDLMTSYNVAYTEVKDFFKSKEDFNIYYTQGKDIFQSELKNRKEIQEGERRLNYLKGYSKFIESMDFQKEKSESLGSVLGRELLTNVAEPDYSNQNVIRTNVLYVLNESKNNSYFPQLVDFVVTTNRKLNKEWSKKGIYFSNSPEFYEAYISGDYKNILKGKR